MAFSTCNMISRCNRKLMCCVAPIIGAIQTTATSQNRSQWLCGRRLRKGLDVLLVNRTDALLEVDFVFPAEFVQPRNVHQLARRTVGFGSVEGQFTVITDHR